MCTQEQAKKAASEAIEEYMTNPNGDGLTVVEHEMKTVMDATISSLVIKFGFALIGVVAVASIAWFQMKGDIESNTEARTTGDRYTQDEHDAYSTVIEERFINIREDMSQLRSDYKEDIKEIKEDLKFIREHLGG